MSPSAVEAAGAGTVGRRPCPGGDRLSLSPRRLQVEPDRASAVQLYQYQLGRETPAFVAHLVGLHPGHDDGIRLEGQSSLVARKVQDRTEGHRSGDAEVAVATP